MICSKRFGHFFFHSNFNKIKNDSKYDKISSEFFKDSDKMSGSGDNDVDIEYFSNKRLLELTDFSCKDFSDLTIIASDDNGIQIKFYKA